MRAAERDIARAAGRRAATPRSSRRAASPRATSASASYPIERRPSAGFSAEPHVRGRARRSRAAVIAAVPVRRARPRAAHVHEVHLGRPPGSGDRAAAAAADRRARRPRRRELQHASTRAVGVVRVRARARGRSSTRCCRATPKRGIFAALLNAAASEHAARQRAMKAATDNADELIRSLSRVDEPRPSGADHDRDHGDRRRRRSAAPTARWRAFRFRRSRAALTASHTGH